MTVVAGQSSASPRCPQLRSASVPADPGLPGSTIEARSNSPEGMLRWRAGIMQATVREDGAALGAGQYRTGSALRAVMTSRPRRRRAPQDPVAALDWSFFSFPRRESGAVLGDEKSGCVSSRTRYARCRKSTRYKQPVTLAVTLVSEAQAVELRASAASHRSHAERTGLAWKTSKARSD